VKQRAAMPNTRSIMSYSRIASCLVATCFVASCALSGDETTDDTSSESAPAADHVATTAQSLLGADACHDVGIHIKNSRTRNGINTAIKVQHAEYFSASEGKWLNENLGDLILDFGITGNWTRDLEHTENDLVTQWKVYYQFIDNGSWSSQVFQVIDTTDATCIANMDFNMTVQ
jgi:hypothetical protein